MIVISDLYCDTNVYGLKVCPNIVCTVLEASEGKTMDQCKNASADVRAQQNCNIGTLSCIGFMLAIHVYMYLPTRGMDIMTHNFLVGITSPSCRSLVTWACHREECRLGYEGIMMYPTQIA